MLSHWWEEGSKGQGIGIANFFSGISHVTAYLLPIMLLSLWPHISWRIAMVIPMGALLVFVILFGIFAVEKPADKNLDEYIIKNPRHEKREEVLRKRAKEDKKPWLYFLRLWRNFWWWCTIALSSSICRYGLLNWIPVYYKQTSGEEVLSETFSNLTLPIGMAFGTLVITWVAETKLFYNKGIVVTAMAALCGTLVVTFPMLENTQSVLVGIFFIGIRSLSHQWDPLGTRYRPGLQSVCRQRGRHILIGHCFISEHFWKPCCSRRCLDCLTTTIW